MYTITTILHSIIDFLQIHHENKNFKLRKLTNTKVIS